MSPSDRGGVGCSLRRLLWSLLALSLLLAPVACGQKASPPRPPTPPGPSSLASTPAADQLRQQAESQQLSRATPALAALVRGQPWFEAMTPAKLALVSLLVECERASLAKGEGRSVREMLQYASEQGWYRDGLDDDEARGLGAVVRAYTRSLTKDNAPAIGPVLGTTIRYQLFRVLSLPETGEVGLVVSSESEALGRRALEIAAAELPRVESLVGKFPYTFLYFDVTDELPLIYAGLSFDEFIALAPEYVDPETIIHEATHSTLYGAFPLWFEEGIAHFLESYLTGQLAGQADYFAAELRAMRAGEKLDLRSLRAYTEDEEFEERAQGFLLLKALYDVEGIDLVSQTIKALRTRTYNDAELLAAIIDQAPETLRPRVRQLFCDRITGTTRNYCAPG